ncbi:DegT/DnrJ/EryC1/StrS family aminotransferase [Candidatus Pacearchaeota archaeon CG10_big_fil_rev_8_21_14_0_10_34_12]|nr:MAG: DegT/DnrJ/EryC1/StrS family aminotransferase [Candidatus Pacearchaeota archaeon CG10_big_fil_rev_8_21_14_0_10_34_12]
MYGPWITDIERKIVEDALSEEKLFENRNYYIEKFEREFAEYPNRKYAIMTSNCTHALHLLLLSLGIGEGDEVIVPDLTWTATAAPITYCKAIPVFCDVDEKNWCASPESIEKKISDKTKAIIVVDLYGNMPDMERITELSKQHNIPLIEDSAEALGSTYKGIKAGKFGIGSIFSFHSTKTITSGGEGGMLLLDDDRLYKKAKILRNHGRYPENIHDILMASPKYMPNNLGAAMGYAQFTRLNEILNKKRWILEQYKKQFKGVADLHLNVDSSEIRNGAWLSSLVFGKSFNLKKEEVMNKIEKQGFPVRPFFYPLSSLSAYKGYGTGSEVDNPVAYDISSRGINLPSSHSLTEQDIEKYCEVIKKIIGDKSAQF